MSDTQPELQPIVPPPPREQHMLDTLASKVFFSWVCFLAPAALAIVIVDFWLRFQGNLPENMINPIYFISQAMTGSGFKSIWPLLLALAPPALILCIIFRETKARVIMLLLLLVAALLEFTGLAQLSPV